jgi:hypothetical protein
MNMLRMKLKLIGQRFHKYVTHENEKIMKTNWEKVSQVCYA